MTVLSAVFGMVFIQFIPPGITRWVSVGLFVVFGLKMLHEGWNMSQTGGSEELEEVQHDIRKREDEVSNIKYIFSHESYASRSKPIVIFISSNISIRQKKLNRLITKMIPNKHNKKKTHILLKPCQYIDES